MMKIVTRPEIEKHLDLERALADQKEGFRLYTLGQVVVPEVGHLHFDEPHGDMHIKYGTIKGSEFYVVKIASGFSKNPQLFGLPVIQGLMLVFSARSGQPLYLLNDEGFLTNVRTAIAGRIAAEILGPKGVDAIGVIGTGTQARLQVLALKTLYPCRKVYIIGRDQEKAHSFADHLRGEGYEPVIAKSADELAKHCQVIITATHADAPVLHASSIKPGTHITAVGTDSPRKHEIDPGIFARADICAVDSVSQCAAYGDASHALKQGLIARVDLVELGAIIADESKGRRDDGQITIADLTGVAVQDIQIAMTVIRSVGSGF